MNAIEHWVPDEMVKRCSQALYRSWQKDETTTREDVRLVLETAFPSNPSGAVEALREIDRQDSRLPATDPVTGEPSPWTIARDYLNSRQHDEEVS